MRRTAAWSLGLAFVLAAGSARADEVQVRWRRTTPQTEQAVKHNPAVRPITLQRPIPLGEGETPLGPGPETRPQQGGTRPQQLEATTPRRFVRAQSPDIPPPPPLPPAGGRRSMGADEEKYNCAVGVHTSKSGPTFIERVGEIPGTVGGWFQRDGCAPFQSDHKFDNFISPVTNPFLFEDPRALTEVRPIFIYQKIPGDNPVFFGGHAAFFGVRASVALFDWLSLSVTKLGWTWLTPDATGPGIPEGNGFSELHVGPKFTILRNDASGSLLALGLNFDFPVGSSRVAQDTGDLSLTPYISFAQTFGKSSWGRFNFMTTGGYSFRTDTERSEYLFGSFHLDYDIGCLQRIYPLIELNWFHYARNGTVRPFGFEGRDLFNFGSMGVAGSDELTLAVGGRYKFSEAIQFGAAIEFPLLNNPDMNDFRITVDMIFRY